MFNALKMSRNYKNIINMFRHLYMCPGKWQVANNGTGGQIFEKSKCADFHATLYLSQFLCAELISELI